MTQERLSSNGSTWPAFSRHLETNPFDNDFDLSTAFSLSQPLEIGSNESYSRSWRWHHERRCALEYAFKRLSQKDIAGKSHIEAYLWDQYRRHLRPSTLRQSLAAIMSFVDFIMRGGKEWLEAISAEDIEGWIEHEQDRGLKVSTVKMRLGYLKAFLRFLVETEVVRPEVLSKRMIIKVPDSLPRAMDPDDVRRLISVIDHVRDRAMVLVLLRTGMRVGELLNTLMEDVNLKQRRIEIYEADKTGVGRVVYLSYDAIRALKAWCKRRDPHKSFLFYAQGRHAMSYPAARAMFHKYLDKAGLSHKGYTLHCLRHTCASELLNAGMRLECVQQLLGHSSIEMTRRYARLTDKTREEEYFRAMRVIERGGSMGIINWIVNYRRFLKKRNYSAHTIKNYMNTLKHFVLWLDVPVEEATNKKLLQYIDLLLDKGLKPKTINSHLDSVRGFYEYLRNEEGLSIRNPVKRGYALRLSRPLPRYLKDEEVYRFLDGLKGYRDKAMFLLMLRCGLRVEEVANLTVNGMDLRRRKLIVECGKGRKGRVVYISDDAFTALAEYLRVRPSSRAKKVFLAEKAPYTAKPISVRGIQKRMEYHARQTGLKISCHRLRHTMATQMLNADADLVTIQDLLGHSRIKTTERYCKVSNLKVQRDYYKAMEVIMQRMGGDRIMT